MAKEVILSVQTGAAIKSISELKEQIKALKEGWTDTEGAFHKGLNQMTIGSAQFRNQLSLLQENEAALRNAMHGISADYEDIARAAQGANVQFDEQGKLINAETASYNELVRVLNILKQQWRTAADDDSRANYSAQINSVNDRLKELDKSVGVFGRNVGNYIGAADHLMAGLSGMGKGAANLGVALKGATAGLKAFSATPAVAILGVLANVLQKVTDALSTSAENTKGLTQAMAPFQAIGDAVTKMLQAMGSVLVGVVDWFGKLTTAILGNNKASEERLRISKEEIELSAAQRENIMRNAEAERDISELRAKAAQRDKYSATERLTFLEEAGKKEAAIAERAMNDARKQYEIIRDRNKLTQTSKENLDKQAQAYADMIKAETHYYNSVRTINTGISRARREEARDARAAAKAVKDAATAKISAEKEYLQQLLSFVEDGSKKRLQIQNTISKLEYEKAVADARQKITNEKEYQRAVALLRAAFNQQLEKNQEEHAEKVRQAELLEIRNIMNGYEQGSVDYLALQVQLLERDYDTLTKLQGESDQAFLARRIEAFKALLAARQEYGDAEVAVARQAMENERTTLEGTLDAYKKAVEIAQFDLDNLHQNIGESNEAFLARQLEAERAYREAVGALQDADAQEQMTRKEQEMALLEENSVEYLTREVELKQIELNTLHQLEGESNDAFRLRELQAEKAYSDAQKKLVQGRISVFQTYAGAISGLLGGIADIYEADTQNNKRSAEKAKNIKVSMGIIDTISGAIGAYMSAVDPKSGIPAPYNVILGGIQAAAVTATGLANVAKIKATPISDSSSGSGSASAPVVPAAVEAPTATPQVQNVRTLTGVQEEERLNEPQRVYILSSDLEADRNARQAQVAETTF